MSRAMLALAIVAGTLAVVLLYSTAALPLAVWHLLTDGGLLLAWLLAAEGIGRQLLRALRINRSGIHAALILASSIGLGLGAMSLVILALGLAGLLDQFTSIALLVVGCALGMRGWISFFHRPATDDQSFQHGQDARVTRKASCDTGFQPVRNAVHGQDALVTSALPKQSSRAGWSWLLLFMIPFAGIMVTGALVAPGLLWGAEDPAGYDVVEYHLQVPREWFDAGRVIPLHHNVFSYFPFNVEMHYLLAMHLRGGPWNGMYLAQLMHAAFIALTFLAIYGAARLTTGRALASIATLAAVFTPWTIMLGSIAYDEGGLLLFGTLSIAWTLRWIVCRVRFSAPVISSYEVMKNRCAEAHPTKKFQSEESLTKVIVLAGLFAGLACGSKLTAVPIVLLAASLALLPRWRASVTFFLCGLLSFSPWLIRNQFWARNPVFPEAMSLFGRAHFSEIQQERWNKAHAPRADQQSLPERFDAFWQQVLSDWRYNWFLLPLALVAAAAAAALTSWRSHAPRFLLVILLLLTLFWLFATHLQSRFFVFAIPLASLLIAQVRWKRWPACAGVILLAGAIMSWMQLNHRFTRFTVAIGAEDADSILFVLSHPPDGTDQALHTGQPIVLVGDAQAFWYRTRRLDYRTVFDVSNSTEKGIVADWIGSTPLTPDTVILVYPSELARFHYTYYAIPELPPQLQFARPFRLNPADIAR